MVMATSVYMGATWKAGQAEATQTNAPFKDLEHKKTEPINVPMIADGNIEGYIVAQFTYLVDAKSLGQLSVPPDVFITDETFRTLYSDQLDFNHLEKYDVAALTKGLVEKVNRRLGGDIIKEMLVDEFNYVTRREISK
jgi:hypothetical protein